MIRRKLILMAITMILLYVVIIFLDRRLADKPELLPQNSGVVYNINSSLGSMNWGESKAHRARYYHNLKSLKEGSTEIAEVYLQKGRYSYEIHGVVFSSVEARVIKTLKGSLRAGEEITILKQAV